MMKMRAQRGAVLLVALIMLVLLTLFAVSALNTGTANLKVVGNMQARSEATDAAKQAVETVLSTPRFITSPADAVLNPCAVANRLCTDVTGDGVADYITNLTPQPTCISVRTIKSVELNLALVADRQCAAGVAQQFGVAGAVSGDSLCGYMMWEITAETTAVASGAKATVTQGVGIRISTDAMATTTACL